MRESSAGLILAALAACSNSPAPPKTGCTVTVDAGCLTNCSTGNELHVGQYCTRGGGECDNNVGIDGGGAVFCSVDFDRDAGLAFCTKQCEINANCGSAAVCTSGTTNPNKLRGCTPTACDPGDPGWTTPDGG